MFIFVQSFLELECSLPFDLGRGFTICRATDSQVQTVVKFLSQMDQVLPQRYNVRRNYEHSKEVTKHEKEKKVTVSWSGFPLPEDDWRYWVITFDQKSDLETLTLALLLPRPSIFLGVGFDDKGGRLNLNTGWIFNFYYSPERITDVPITIKEDFLLKIKEYLELVTIAKEKNLQGYLSLESFLHMCGLPFRSPHHVLLCFAIIEELITHEPKDKGDSLNRQLPSKMILLEKFFDNGLEFELFGKNLGRGDRKSIWKALYDYRSKIAHGASFEFKKEFGSSLKTPEIALEFLRDAAKLLMLVALKNPELLENLKEV